MSILDHAHPDHTVDLFNIRHYAGAVSGVCINNTVSDLAPVLIGKGGNVHTVLAMVSVMVAIMFGWFLCTTVMRAAPLGPMCTVGRFTLF